MKQQDHYRRALGWILLGGIGFSIMSAFVKKASPAVSSFELVFYRSLINFIFLTPVLFFQRGLFFPKEKQSILVIRSLAGLIALSCHFYSISIIPLSVAYLLHSSYPLFVFFLSGVFLRERFERIVFLFVGCSFIGLYLLVDPDFETQTTAVPLGGFSIALLGAVFMGVAYSSLRAASAHFKPSFIVWYFTGFASICSFPLAWPHFKLHELTYWFDILAVGGLASGAQYCLTQAYRWAPAGPVSVMGLSSVVFACIWGLFLFDETLSLNQVGGILLLIGGIAFLTLKGNASRVKMR